MSSNAKQCRPGHSLLFHESMHHTTTTSSSSSSKQTMPMTKVKGENDDAALPPIKPPN
jgi:hypothetical protein